MRFLIFLFFFFFFLQVCLYRWLFEFSSTQLNRNINHFLKGVNRLFWLVSTLTSIFFFNITCFFFFLFFSRCRTDVHHDNYHYAAIFNYLVDEIMQNPFQRSCVCRKHNFLCVHGFPPANVLFHLLFRGSIQFGGTVLLLLSTQCRS